MNTTAGFCHLKVVNGWLTSDWDGTKVTVPGSMAEYWFKDHAALALPATVHPVELSRAIHSPLIDHLLTDLMNHPAQLRLDAFWVVLLAAVRIRT